MTVVEFPNGSGPEKQGFIGHHSALPENVRWLRKPYLGLAMTPERRVLAAIVDAMPERQSTKVLKAIRQLQAPSATERGFGALIMTLVRRSRKPPEESRLWTTAT